jgi:hypothetical protein
VTAQDAVVQLNGDPTMSSKKPNKVGAVAAKATTGRTKSRYRSVQSKVVDQNTGSSRQNTSRSKTDVAGDRHRSGNIGPQTSKQATVVGMLQRKQGASISAIVGATGWQPHSVRGFFAGVVRKKLRLNLISEKTGTKRTYRVVAETDTHRKAPSQKTA